MSTKARKHKQKDLARPPQAPGQARSPSRPGARRGREGGPRVSGGVKAALVVGLVVVALLGVFLAANGQRGHKSAAGRYAYQVGDPGPGRTAPAIKLAATNGTFDLSAPSGQTTLLYFQEGLSCQPCWDQLADIQANLDAYRALGITRILSITTDPLDAIRQKVADQHLTIPVAADPDLAVSRAYHANDYGMMGQGRDGHSFIVVGADGVIRWRADYGGAPHYTMFVPSGSLLADLRAGLAGQTR